jgi:hypothetical protein
MRVEKNLANLETSTLLKFKVKITRDMVEIYITVEKEI